MISTSNWSPSLLFCHSLVLAVNTLLGPMRTLKANVRTLDLGMLLSVTAATCAVVLVWASPRSVRNIGAVVILQTTFQPFVAPPLYMCTITLFPKKGINFCEAPIKKHRLNVEPCEFDEFVSSSHLRVWNAQNYILLGHSLWHGTPISNQSVSLEKSRSLTRLCCWTTTPRHHSNLRYPEEHISQKPLCHNLIIRLFWSFYSPPIGSKASVFKYTLVFSARTFSSGKSSAVGSNPFSKVVSGSYYPFHLRTLFFSLLKSLKRIL